MWPGLRRLFVCGLIAGIAGCELPRDITKTPRSSIEQLLLSQALDRTLFDIFLPLSLQDALVCEVTGLQSGFPAPSGDLLFVKDIVAARLGGLGYRIVKNEQDAAFIVRVVVQSFGTNQSASFFGMPPIQSVLIPFALPQLTRIFHRTATSATRWMSSSVPAAGCITRRRGTTIKRITISTRSCSSSRFA